RHRLRFAPRPGGIALARRDLRRAAGRLGLVRPRERHVGLGVQGIGVRFHTPVWTAAGMCGARKLPRFSVTGRLAIRFTWEMGSENSCEGKKRGGRSVPGGGGGVIVCAFSILLPAGSGAVAAGGAPLAGGRPAMRQFVDEGEIAGAVTVVGRREAILG